MLEIKVVDDCFLSFSLIEPVVSHDEPGGAALTSRMYFLSKLCPFYRIESWILLLKITVKRHSLLNLENDSIFQIISIFAWMVTILITPTVPLNIF